MGTIAFPSACYSCLVSARSASQTQKKRDDKESATHKFIEINGNWNVKRERRRKVLSPDRKKELQCTSERTNDDDEKKKKNIERKLNPRSFILVACRYFLPVACAIFIPIPFCCFFFRSLCSIFTYSIFAIPTHCCMAARKEGITVLRYVGAQRDAVLWRNECHE